MYPILPKERGDARFGPAYLRCQTILQVAERWSVWWKLAQKVRVYPNLQQAQRAALYLIRSRQTQMERRLRRQRGRGREFESLREFRAGDEYREICWTASARRGHLVTKVNQVERSQTVWIVLDAGRLLRARINGPSKLDYAVGAALSLAHVALLSGDNVGMLAYGRKVQQRCSAGQRHRAFAQGTGGKFGDGARGMERSGSFARDGCVARIAKTPQPDCLADGSRGDSGDA